MKIKLASLMVKDQNHALDFYTNTLGFIEKNNVSMGEYSWLTVVSPDSDYVELLLEPMAFAPARDYQKALFDAGIPATAFEVNNIAEEHKRLSNLGVVFKTPPTKAGPVTIAVLDDTCGNLIQLYQM